MFRFNWKELNPVKFIGGILGRKQESTRKTIESPWLEGLDSLASRYTENPMQPTSYEIKDEAALEAEEQLRQLCTDVQAGLGDEKDRVVVRKERKQTSTTSVDLKAWWGQSVATWDPTIDGKNLDSIEQQQRRRKAKWFDQTPHRNDLGHP